MISVLSFRCASNLFILPASFVSIYSSKESTPNRDNMFKRDYTVCIRRFLGGRGTMALLQLPVTRSGHCLVAPACVGLVTEPRDALLLLEQEAVEPSGECCCHAAFLYATVNVSNILIIDRNSNEHVFMVMTSVLLRMLGIDWLQERTDGISCTNLQARILRSTDLGNAVAAGLRQFKRC